MADKPTPSLSDEEVQTLHSLHKSSDTNWLFDGIGKLYNSLLARIIFVLAIMTGGILGLDHWRDTHPKASGTHAVIQDLTPDPVTKVQMMHVPVNYVDISNGPRILHPGDTFSCLDDVLVILIASVGEIHTQIPCSSGFIEYTYDPSLNDNVTLQIIGDGYTKAPPPTDANVGYTGE